MTRVDFYVLENPNERQHGTLVCRLAEKAWREGHRVFIHCDEPNTAAKIDDLLWTFKDTAFVPHAREDAPDAAATPITIACSATAPSVADVMINLANEVPDFFSRFERVMETTGVTDNSRSAARERYRYYQERGYTLNTHKLDQKHA